MTVTAISPGALDLLRLLSQRPIPVSKCYRLFKKELNRSGYAKPELSTIVTMDKDANGVLRETANRQGVMLCITPQGKDYLDELEQENSP